MPHPAADPTPIECLLRTLLACLTPFYLGAAGGDPAAASAAAIELIESHGAVSAAQIDIIGQMLTFAAAAMDNLRLSTREGLSDRKILQFRAGAVALGRSAEQCRKALDAMRTGRPQQGTADVEPPAVPVAPLQPTAPSRATPVVRPIAAAHLSTVDGEPAFATDIASMQRNALAMLADLRARAEGVLAETPESPAAIGPPPQATRRAGFASM